MEPDRTQIEEGTPEKRSAAAEADRGAGPNKTRKLVAYRLLPNGPKLVPGSVNRAWMDATVDRWAYRCLPLNMANEAGWMILNSRDVEVTWNGNARPDGLRVKFLDGPPTSDVVSLFGHGIVTWRVAYLFRTPPGFNLLVRGPANIFKEATSPLEGLVESDWSVANFTMNWKITIPWHKVRFGKDEPIGMLVPQRRYELESFRPEIRNIESNPELEESFNNWSADRNAFIRENFQTLETGERLPWQKHYLRGVGPSGEAAPQHQVRMELPPFKEQEPPLRQDAARRRGAPESTALHPAAPRSATVRFKRWLNFMLGSLQRWSY